MIRVIAGAKPTIALTKVNIPSYIARPPMCEGPACDATSIPTRFLIHANVIALAIANTTRGIRRKISFLNISYQLGILKMTNNGMNTTEQTTNNKIEFNTNPKNAQNG